MTTYDVAIIGGGIAGGTAAYHAAKSGVKVLLLEKEARSHHKVCGEFISGEGLPFIAQMGIDLRAHGAMPISSFRLHGPRRTGEARLPLAAMGFSRERLDELILAQAGAAGATVLRGVLVKEHSEGLETPAGVIRLQTTAGEFSASRLIVATGKSDFKSLRRRKGRDSGLVGFKMHLRLRPSALKRLRDHCDLFVFEGGYGGLAPIENGLANFCFLIERARLKKLKSDWNSLAVHIAKHNTAISHYLDGAVPQFPQFVAVAQVPYGFLRRELPDLGVYCVGDQMAVIPSLTGDGMTIALRTGLAAAEAIVDKTALKPPETSIAYQRKVRAGLKTQIETAYLLHRLFKNPRLCDWAAFAMKSFPPVLDFFFRSTRCHLPGPAEPTNTPANTLVGQF